MALADPYKCAVLTCWWTGSEIALCIQVFSSESNLIGGVFTFTEGRL